MNRSIYTKLSIVFITFLFGLSLSACKKNDPVIEPIVIDEEGDKELVNITLPETFPSSLIPIYPNSHLFNVVEVNKSYTIMFYSKDESSLIIDFYKNVFKDATNKMETNQDNSYTIFGELSGYTFTFDCGPEDDLEGYKTLVLLNVVMNQK